MQCKNVRKFQSKEKSQRELRQAAVNNILEPALESEGLTLLDNLRISECSRVTKEVIERNWSGGGTEVEKRTAGNEGEWRRPHQ